LLIVSPALRPFWPLSGRNSTYPTVQICRAGSLAGIVGDLHHEFAEKFDQLDVLRLYLDNRCLISARRRPLAAIDKLRRSIGDGLKVDRPVAIIAQFLHHVTDTLGDLLIELTSNVDDLEDQLLAGKISDRIPELARIRRIVVRLRRHMVPQQHALISLLSRLPAWIDVEGAAGLRNAIERLSALGHDLDLVQERARLLGDQLSSRLMEATNRNLYVLSIVTAVFLPMTLVTGIFGMNLGGLPEQQDPLGFWYGMAIMLALGVGTLFLLRRRRML
jgi:zinc transporter